MVRTSKAARLPETQNSACAQNQTAEQTAAQATGTLNNPMVTVYDGGITEEIIHGYQKTKLNFLFSRNWGSYPLSDGRYVYEEWTGSGKNLHLKKKAYSGIRPNILALLTETDRNDNNGQRKTKEHADYSVRFEDGGEDENGDFHQSAMDKAAYQQWLWMETRDAAEDDPIYPDEILKLALVPGDNKVNNQRWQMRRQVVDQYIPNLSWKDQEAFIKYYGMCMTEEQIGAEEGVGKQAICNRIARAKDDLRKVFTQLGIPFPTDEELEDERKKRKAREDAFKEAEKERKEDEREAREIRALMRQENAQGSATKTDKNEDDEPMGETYNDVDPDTPYDSVNEDFDPYEAYDIYKDEESEEDYWEEDAEE